MQIKICGSHLTYKSVNVCKCLNVCERVELTDRNKDDHLPYPAVLWIIGVCERDPDRKKYIYNNFWT